MFSQNSRIYTSQTCIILNFLISEEVQRSLNKPTTWVSNLNTLQVELMSEAYLGLCETSFNSSDFQLFHDRGPYHKETSPLICRVN